MKQKIIRGDSLKEFWTPERCFISELQNQSDDEKVSIALAKVEEGIETQLHYLKGIDERYLIVSGKGRVEIEGMPSTIVGKGDLVSIPSGKTQKIKNIGKTDLLFYCICTPKFVPSCYFNTEKNE